MSKRDRPHVSYFNMGPWPVFVGCTTSPDAFGREMKRLRIDNPPRFLVHGRAGATCHTFVNRSALTCIIAISAPHAKINRHVYAALLAHEAVHVVQEMRDELAGGKSLGDEAEAYLVQLLVQECLAVAFATGASKNSVPKP